MHGCSRPAATSSMRHWHRQTRHRIYVTNEGKEVKVNRLYEEAGLLEDGTIMVDPENPVPNPHLGPLERRVSITFEEGLAMDTVDQEAMSYWFTEPAQGWQTEKRRLRKAEGVPVDDDFDEFRHAASSTSGRKALENVTRGDILPGTVVEQLLHHGLRVDVGCEADALVPMRGIQLWKSAAAKGCLPNVGDRIEVRVVSVAGDPLFRFPLVAAPLDEALASVIPSAEEYTPALDLRDVPVSRYEEVAKMSGRESTFGTQNVLVVPDDMDVLSGKEDFVLSEEDVLLFDSIVSDL